MHVGPHVPETPGPSPLRGNGGCFGGGGCDAGIVGYKWYLCLKDQQIAGLVYQALKALAVEVTSPGWRMVVVAVMQGFGLLRLKFEMKSAAATLGFVTSAVNTMSLFGALPSVCHPQPARPCKDFAVHRLLCVCVSHPMRTTHDKTERTQNFGDALIVPCLSIQGPSLPHYEYSLLDAPTESRICY